VRARLLGFDMKARQLIENSSFAANEVKALGEAF
jgi:hypothetical protein